MKGRIYNTPFVNRSSFDMGEYVEIYRADDRFTRIRRKGFSLDETRLTRRERNSMMLEKIYPTQFEN